MIKERFISKFSLLLVVINLAFGARHINLINLALKQRRFCVFRNLDSKFIFCHVGTL
ncbi:hypothetical protein [Campylobacter concisus]|uniref:hypothetical protein n=1 Tax=Campylobacter concisus TaxID=199 RepID=UPI00131C85C0|nr:hypothetical protein [Campylobacter concisus]